MAEASQKELEILEEVEALKRQFDDRTTRQREHSQILMRLRRQAKAAESRDDAARKELTDAEEQLMAAKGKAVMDAVSEGLLQHKMKEEETKMKQHLMKEAEAAMKEELRQSEEVKKLEKQLEEKERRAREQRERIDALKEEQLMKSMAYHKEEETVGFDHSIEHSMEYSMEHSVEHSMEHTIGGLPGQAGS